MEQKHIDSVRQFRKMMGLPSNDKYQRLTETQAEFHFQMLKDEHEEMLEAIGKGDKVSYIDGVIDYLIYAMGALDHSGLLVNILDDVIIEYWFWEDMYVNLFFRSIKEYCADEFFDIKYFEIVMESNLSKACSSMEAAKRLQDEYESKWAAQENDYDSKCLIKESEFGICLYRRYPSGEIKLLKGDKFVAPEPRLKEAMGL